MRLPAFDHTRMQWDAWRAFHVVHTGQYGPFVQFDTGEFIVCRSSWRPAQRRVHGGLHIQIAGTDDPGCPRLYVPGRPKPIPRSHLNHKGQQILLLDLDCRRAVGLSPWLTRDDAPLVPERFTAGSPRGISAWYAGPGAMPVGAPVTRHWPQPLTRTQRRHINELADAGRVWLGMQPQSGQATLRLQHRDVRVPAGAFASSPFGALTTEQRVAVAVRGFDMIVRESHPWLTFNIGRTLV